MVWRMSRVMIRGFPSEGVNQRRRSVVVNENSVRAENAKISSACRQLSAGETDRSARAAAMQRRDESQSVESRAKSGLGSRFRSIFGQRQMSSEVLVVGKITSQSPAQRSCIPHDDVVQAFPANGTDQPLHKRILPWRSRRGNHFLYPQAFRHFYPVIPVDPIAVARISAPLVPGKRFPDLLHRPILAGVVGHLEVQHTASSMG